MVDIIPKEFFWQILSQKNLVFFRFGTLISHFFPNHTVLSQKVVDSPKIGNTLSQSVKLYPKCPKFLGYVTTIWLFGNRYSQVSLSHFWDCILPAVIFIV